MPENLPTHGSVNSPLKKEDFTEGDIRDLSAHAKAIKSTQEMDAVALDANSKTLEEKQALTREAMNGARITIREIRQRLKQLAGEGGVDIGSAKYSREQENLMREIAAYNKYAKILDEPEITFEFFRKVSDPEMKLAPKKQNPPQTGSAVQ